MLEPTEDDQWATKFFTQDIAFSDDDLNPIKSFLVDVPKEHKQKSLGIDSLESKIDLPSIRPGGRSGATRRLRTGARRGALALEPYDPDARDADGDGIVQEGTAWERPATARILDALGNEIRRGQQASVRPTGIRVVDVDGNDVDYKPTYEGGRAGTIGGSTVQQVRPSVKPPRSANSREASEEGCGEETRQTEERNTTSRPWRTLPQGAGLAKRS